MKLSLVVHEIIPHCCIKNAILDDYVLKCRKCGEPIAICHENTIVVLPRFEKYKNKIIDRVLDK